MAMGKGPYATPSALHGVVVPVPSSGTGAVVPVLLRVYGDYGFTVKCPVITIRIIRGMTVVIRRIPVVIIIA
jgi:hypothetical protein